MGDAVQEPIRMTNEEFLLWREGRPGTWELWDGVPVEKFSRDPTIMGATDNHSTVSGNIYFQLRLQLKGKTCRARNDQIAINVEEGASFQPDVGVDCGRSDDPVNNMKYINPVCVVEVLSPSTERYDKKVKLPKYMRVPSISYILYVRKDYSLVELYSRNLQIDSWEIAILSDFENDIIDLKNIEVKLSLKDIYEDVALQD